MSNLAIMSAFSNSVATFAAANTIPVAYENVTVSFATGQHYLNLALLPGQTIAAGVGPDAFNRHRGVFQVDVVYPFGTAWGLAHGMVDKVCSHFKRGTKLDSNKLLILSVSPGPGFRDETLYRVPVSVRYYGHYAK